MADLNMKRAAAPEKPDGITVFGIFIIIGSIFGLLNTGASRMVNYPLSVSLYLVIEPVSIVTGIFLIRLKNFARITIVIISLVVAFETAISMPYVIKRSQERYLDQIIGAARESIDLRAQKQNLPSPRITPERVEAVKGILRPVLQVILIVFGAVSMIFNAAVIYYFTRPKIRRWFTKEAI